MKNALEIYVEKEGLKECDVMNLLQGLGGPISDLCVTAADVWGPDAERAVRWLSEVAGAVDGDGSF